MSKMATKTRSIPCGDENFGGQYSRSVLLLYLLCYILGTDTFDYDEIILEDIRKIRWREGNKGDLKGGGVHEQLLRVLRVMQSLGFMVSSAYDGGDVKVGTRNVSILRPRHKLELTDVDVNDDHTVIKECSMASAFLMLQSLLLPLILGKAKSVTVYGGVDVSFAPPSVFFKSVFLPVMNEILASLGVSLNMEIGSFNIKKKQQDYVKILIDRIEKVEYGLDDRVIEVDPHLADQLIVPLCVLTDKPWMLLLPPSTVLTKDQNNHIEAQIEFVKTFLSMDIGMVEGCKIVCKTPGILCQTRFE